jgi:hypothetical protein
MYPTRQLATVSTVPQPVNAGEFVHRLTGCACRPDLQRFGHDPNCQGYDWRCCCDWCWPRRFGLGRWPESAGAQS